MNALTPGDVAAIYERRGEPVPADVAAMLAPAKKHKYCAEPCEVDGIRFPSKLEAHCWRTLRAMEQAREIANLRRQVAFDLGAGIKYVADFVCERDGRVTVIEAKGAQTPAWRLKKRLFERQHPETPLIVWTQKNVGELL